MRLITAVALAAIAGVTLNMPAASATPETAAPPKYSVPGVPHTGRLEGVSCVSPTRCVAVGASGHLALIETWNGRGWSFTAPPRPGITSNLAAVSCTSSTQCVAVGSFYPGPTSYRALIETWNGKYWSLVPSPKPPTDETLTGVSCVSAARCIAVGISVNGGPNRALAKSWNGKQWRATPVPEFPPGWSTVLSGVSCTSNVHCVAVGTLSPPGTPTLTLVETWDGTRWSVTPTPTHGQFFGRSLQSVSCASPTSCFAVGRTGSNTGADPTFIERWDGTRWSLMHSPNYPIAYAVNQLSGISCASPTSCVAVGSAIVFRGRGYITRTLIESWDGQRWTFTPSPPASGTRDQNSLAAVSCTTAHCAAVGYFNDTAGRDQTLGFSGVVPRRSVWVWWTPAENARLKQIAAYMGLPPATAQKASVYATAYLLAFGDRTPTPVTLPPMGSAAPYRTVWDPSELTILDTVRAKYALGSVGATRLSVGLVSYLYALQGR